MCVYFQIYFRLFTYILILSVLKVLVDKRMFLGTLKKDLEPYVGVPVEYFKIYRLYSGQQEFECARFKESLGSYHDDDKLIIRLGRALKKGEHRGKVYQLLPNASEVMWHCKSIVLKLIVIVFII